MDAPGRGGRHKVRIASDLSPSPRTASPSITSRGSTYLDVSIASGGVFQHLIARGHNAFAYAFEGQGRFGVTPDDDGERIRGSALAVLNDGDLVEVRADEGAVRFLLVSGQPLYEPIARYGPFVMNTREEIEQALRDLRSDTFVWTPDRSR